MSIETAIVNLKRNHFDVSRFETAREAADYIDRKVDARTVGMGGSVTIDELGLYDKLKTHNTVYWHMKEETEEAMLDGCNADVYITSANAISEAGEIINIDGRGNRVAGTLMKKQKVYIIVGTNKISADFREAMDRARNVAAPLNCRRLEKKTPCAVAGKCFDCTSPERICNALVVFWRKPTWCESMEVVIVDKELGY
jgi:Uncharacterised ACR, YkgG family COG1556.